MRSKKGSGLGVNGSIIIIIYETGQARQTQKRQDPRRLSHTSHVSHALPPPPLSRARFSLSQEMSVPPCPLSTLPACPSKLPVPVGVFRAQLIYASRRLIRDAALPTCLTCAKMTQCDVSDKYTFTLHSRNLFAERRYAQWLQH